MILGAPVSRRPPHKTNLSQVKVINPLFEYLIFILGALCLSIGITIAVQLRKPGRRYTGPGSVAKIYDDWTTDQKMKSYWSNHLHAGFYGQPPKTKDFIQAKFDMIDEMVRWGIAEPDPALFERMENPRPETPPVRILDVGCGVGGSATHLAQRWSKSVQVIGITLSSAQAHFAIELARSHGLQNTAFVECDAMAQAFTAESFDFIWSLESEMHMPDKEQFLRELSRILKPGGRLVIATWNVRDTRSALLTTAEQEHVQYLVDEWCHTKFDGIPESVQLMERFGLREVVSDDWTAATLPSWREAVLVALRDMRGLLGTGPKIWWLNIRDAYTILRFDTAFRKGLCVYGMFRGEKPAGS